VAIQAATVVTCFEENRSSLANRSPLRKLLMIKDL